MSCSTIGRVFRLVAALAAVAGVSWFSSAAWALDPTVQDFSAVFGPTKIPYVTAWQGGDPPPPAVLGGGWDGNFLRLTHEGSFGQFNQAYWDQTDSGAYDLLTVDFDFSISVGQFGGADGIGVALLSVANYGASGIGPGFGEDPNLVNSFGMGIDTFNNGPPDDLGENTVSLHFNGVNVASTSIDFSAIPTVENGSVYHASLTLANDGLGGINATVVISDGVNTIVPHSGVAIPGMTTYDARLAIGARTGGANANHDIDNVQVEFTPVGDVPHTSILEDFEPVAPPVILGGTNFTVAQYDSAPGPQITPGGNSPPSPTAGFARLTQETTSQQNVLTFDRTSTADSPTFISAEFDFRILNVAGGFADGVSMQIVDCAVYGETGALPYFGVAEEPNLANGFGLAMDTFNNGPGDADSDNAVSIHWNGSLVGIVPYPGYVPIDLANGVWNHVQVIIEKVAGGSNVTVLITDGTDSITETVFDNYFVAGMEFTGGVRLGFAGRTGGAYDFHDIDNVLMEAVPEPASCSLAAVALALGTAGLWRRRRRPA